MLLLLGRHVLLHTCQATTTDFIITGSVDGHLKFWKKQETGIEFVKHYRAHLGAVDGEGHRLRGAVSLSWGGRYTAAAAQHGCE